MALLVCYVDESEKIDWSDKAIYLDQSFYELMVRYCMDANRHSTLKEMVSIGYDDEYIISVSQAEFFLLELKELIKKGSLKHAQLQSFANVLCKAISRKCNLVIGGDMYPDLSKNLKSM